MRTVLSSVSRATRPLFFVVAVAAIAPSSKAAAGGIGFRQLTTAYPCAVQSGTTADVQLRSNFSLDGTYASFFAPPGPTMRLLETKPVEAPLTKRGQVGTPHKMQVVVPAGQMPGLHEFRLATPAAVSSVAHILVTDYPVVLETTTENGTPSQAQPVAVPAAVCGQCPEPEDVDCFRMSGKKGEQLTFQIYAQRMTQAVHDMVGKAGYHMDPILTLTGPNGQIVGMNDNYFGGDALLSVELPQDGNYVLAVRDTRYVGDPRYSYCVEITRGLPALTTFPLVFVGFAVSEADVVSISGRTIGRAPIIPARSKVANVNRKRLSIAGTATNPVEFGSEPFEQLIQTEAIAEAKPREVKLPVGVNGRLSRPDDAHRFAFVAKKDAYYALQVDARRYGLPLDAVLEVYDVAGKKVAEADDLPLTPDPKLSFRAPADGRYVVCVRDLHDRGGIDFTYHLTIQPVGPDFEVSGKLYYALLAPGTHTLWFADVTRLNGFEGPVEIHVSGLPAGVTQTPVTVPPGMTRVGIILSADKTAQVGASLVKIIGKAETIDAATGSNRTIEHEAEVLCELQSQGGSQGYWPVRTSVVGVAKQLDLLRIEAIPSELKLNPGDKVDLTVKIERSPSYKDPVGLEFTWGYFTGKLGEQLPPGVSLGKSSVTRLAGNTLEGKMTLEATSAALPVERLPIAVLAGVSVSFSIDTKYASNPIFLTIPAETKKPAAVAKK
ncbi:MAG: hypothetical protein K8U03_25605 [Planctomycetia bacterium]|nr:hypothetical protein [Planctomycetia bacterium]